MLLSVSIGYFLGLSPRDRRRMMFERFEAYGGKAQPEILAAAREAMPASCVPAFDELIAAMRAADWKAEP